MAGLMPSWGGLHTVDLLLLAVLLLSVVIGLFRGLVFELMSLLGWGVAYVVAKLYAPLLAPWLSSAMPMLAPDSAAQRALAFGAVFIAALLAWSLLSRLLRMLVRATPLSVVDRLLGGLFGVLRGAVLLLAVITVLGMTPAARSEAWRQSQGVAWFLTLQDGLKSVLSNVFPAEISRYFPS